MAKQEVVSAAALRFQLRLWCVELALELRRGVLFGELLYLAAVVHRDAQEIQPEIAS